ncbi:Chromosome-partitioning protein Spo0J [Blautia luti]|uniref:Chromosome-partitioning protein Spo0J n=2 Tax=Lachnospiraceae TaxID=186803 RepID=A0A564W228_9FIRM|nr:Chromosome-partitioning protein Spo0J [Blautia luti]
MAKKKEMCSLENHESGAGIVLMKLEELHSFEGHPFKVERNQELFELRCSIEKEGVLVPLLVRKNPHGDGYEIISGHRRKEAALWAGLTKVPVIIRELDDDQSVIAMIDSNLQREKILPSEKAFAYKMRLEAMKHQGRLESDTSDPLEPKCKTELVNVSELEAELQKLGKVKIQKKGGAEGKRSNEQLASMVGESVTQIKRYIRLTHLIPNLTYKSSEQMEQLGKYGFLRRDYLKNHRNSTYQVMLLQDTIGEHLLEVDKAARQREEVILKQLEEKEPLPDKEKDQMAWVRAANQHRAIAEEIILKELIYV